LSSKWQPEQWRYLAWRGISGVLVGNQKAPLLLLRNMNAHNMENKPGGKEIILANVGEASDL
jgi:hypothetical protein